VIIDDTARSAALGEAITTVERRLDRLDDAQVQLVFNLAANRIVTERTIPVERALSDAIDYVREVAPAFNP
jgi:hypothetical protein